MKKCFPYEPAHGGGLDGFDSFGENPDLIFVVIVSRPTVCNCHRHTVDRASVALHHHRFILVKSVYIPIAFAKNSETE